MKLADIVVPIIIALVTGVPGIYAVWALQRKTKAAFAKTDAEAIDVLTEAAKGLVEPMKAQIAELRRDLDEEKSAHDKATQDLLCLQQDRLADQLKIKGLEAQQIKDGQAILELRGQLANKDNLINAQSSQIIELNDKVKAQNEIIQQQADQIALLERQVVKLQNGDPK